MYMNPDNHRLSVRIASVGKVLMMLMLGIFALTSCSEEDDSVDEFENWQSKNDTYWSNLYTETQQKIAAGDTSWKIFPSWSLVGQVPLSTATSLSLSPTDYVIAHVVNEGEGGEKPMYTDSVRIHYQGRLIPSPTYTSGLIFDASWSGSYDLTTMRPIQSMTSDFINGFTTALLQMHKGDRWTVYIPYKLAYGATTPGSTSTSTSSYTTTTSTSSSSSVVQPYSNLIFDITLVDFYRPGTTVPVVY